MFALIGFYVFGFLGFVMHVLLKIQDKYDNGSVLAVWTYIQKHQVRALLSVITYTIIYWMWAKGAILVLRDLSMWFSPLIAYSANSIWGHLVGIVANKVKPAAVKK